MNTYAFLDAIQTRSIYLLVYRVQFLCATASQAPKGGAHAGSNLHWHLGAPGPQVTGFTQNCFLLQYSPAHAFFGAGLPYRFHVLFIISSK